MTSLELLKAAREWPIFSLQDCAKWFPADRRSALILGLNRATASGLVFRLRRGLYLLNQEPYPDSIAIAARIDPRAVISLETVLSRAGLIPEIPFSITSITPAGTARYAPPIGGTCIFRHIKSSLLFGFTVAQHGPYSVRVATPEKALLDLLWFHRFERDKSAYLEELRLDISPAFSWKNFRAYAKLFSNPYISEFSHHVEKMYS